jgi:ribosome-associated protein
MEKDKISLTTPTVSVPLGYYQKFGNIAVQKAELALLTIQQIQDEEKQRKEAEILSQIAVKGIQEKKGKNITIIDFDGVDGSLFEYYVICTANSPSHVDAITDSIDKEIKQATGLNPRKVEGLQNCQWVLLDYFDVVVHVFLEETREFYNIEAMWKDVKQTHLEDID